MKNNFKTSDWADVINFITQQKLPNGRRYSTDYIGDMCGLDGSNIRRLRLHPERDIQYVPGLKIMALYRKLKKMEAVRAKNR